MGRRAFDLQTVGEGVEDSETLELLRELDVDFAQGFHIARPEPFTERPGDRREPVRIGARPVGQTSDATQPGSAQAQAGAAAAASELYLGAFAEADFAGLGRNAP